MPLLSKNIKLSNVFMNAAKKVLYFYFHFLVLFKLVMYSHNNLSLLSTNDVFVVKQIVENILLPMHFFFQNRM